MSVYYEADIVVGGNSWTVTSDDDPTLTVGSPLPLGGLEFGWSLPTQDTYPCQPDPMDASIGIIAADAADVVVDIGNDVAIKVRFDNTGDYPLEFYGRVTDLIATPHDLGWLVSVLALDYMVDDDRNINAASWPQETADLRLTRVFAEAGVTIPSLPGGAFAALTHPAVDISSEPWAGLAVKALDNMIGDSAGVPFRSILAPVIIGTARDFAFDPIGKTYDDPLPGEFGDTGNGYGILYTPDPANGVLDACRVERSVQWSRRKYDGVNRLEIAASDDSVIVASNGATPVLTGRLTLDAVSMSDTSPSIAEFYLPDNGAVSRWAIDSLVWRMDKEDQATLEALTQGWMPVHSVAAGDEIRTLAYRRLVVVSDIPDHQNPAASRAYTGQLRSARFSIADGDPRMEFTMRRTLPEPTADPITPAGLAGSAFSAVTVAQLDPDFTVYDYRLCQEL